MSRIHFFTGQNSITQTQLSAQAYGSISDNNNKERYNLDNKFFVTANAPAYAITKSLLLTVEDADNSDLLNIALLPVNSYSAGFPVSIFIYRGILKNSLIDSNGYIKESDSSWASSNILDVIKSLQDKINQANNTNDTANLDSLGLQFNNAPNEIYIESLYFNDENFHPIIVPEGCQIGKFIGGSAPVSIQIVLDRIGYESKLELLKSSEQMFSIDILDLTGLDPDEQLKQKFINRYEKEYVLNFLDITAFYGSCKNQNIKIQGVDMDDTFLEKFYNKNSVYIDIRDDRGFSYNHFYNLEDNLDIGFHTANQNNEVIFDTINYYQKWPILALKDQIYNPANIKNFYIKIPLKIGMPENLNILSGFTGGVSVNNSKDRKSSHHVLTTQEIDGTITLKQSESIKLSNWSYTDNKLGANYFFLKKSISEYPLDKMYIDSVWNSFFSLKMENIFGNDDIEDGEYRVKTYAPYNSPVIADIKNNELFLPVTGIAVDKFHVTLFAYYGDCVYSETKNKYISPVKIFGTGRYKVPIYSDELNYDPQIKGLGFLNQVVKQGIINNFALESYSYDDNSENYNFLLYDRKMGERNTDIIFENFHAITLTHEEYDALKAIDQSSLSNTEFVSEHPFYIIQKTPETFLYNRFKHIMSTVRLSAPKLTTIDEVNYSIYLTDTDEDILVNGDSIEINGAVTT